MQWLSACYLVVFDFTMALAWQLFISVHLHNAFTWRFPLLCWGVIHTLKCNSHSLKGIYTKPARVSQLRVSWTRKKRFSVWTCLSSVIIVMHLYACIDTCQAQVQLLTLTGVRHKGQGRILRWWLNYTLLLSCDDLTECELRRHESADAGMAQIRCVHSWCMRLRSEHIYCHEVLAKRFESGEVVSLQSEPDSKNEHVRSQATVWNPRCH